MRYRLNQNISAHLSIDESLNNPEFNIQLKWYSTVSHDNYAKETISKLTNFIIDGLRKTGFPYSAIHVSKIESEEIKP